MKVSTNILQHYVPLNGSYRGWVQILAIFTAALGCLSSGALLAWTSPAIPALTSNSSHVGIITLNECSYLTIIPPIASAICSPIFAMLIDRIGRKKTIICMSMLHFMAWLLSGCAKNLTTLYVARIFVGCADASVFNVIPVYIGEIAQPKIRSSWGNLMAFFAFLGQLLVNVAGSYWSIKYGSLLLSGVPVIQFVLILFLPESPYFLLMQNHRKDAEKSLQTLRWTKQVNDEFVALSKSVLEQVAQAGTLKDLLCVPCHRKTLIISLGIRAAQQFSGLPAFFMYTQYIFDQAGSDVPAEVSAIIFSGVFLIVVTVFSIFIGRFRRKLLMATSCSGCAVLLTVQCVYFFVVEKTDLDVANVGWIPLASMFAYIPASSCGLAIIPTLLLGELFATNIKGIAMCILNIFFAGCILTVSKIFHELSVNFGMFAPFGLFALCCYANIFFSCYCIPETKGKTLEEIQEKIKNGNNRTVECLQMNDAIVQKR